MIVLTQPIPDWALKQPYSGEAALVIGAGQVIGGCRLDHDGDVLTARDCWAIGDARLPHWADALSMDGVGLVAVPVEIVTAVRATLDRITESGQQAVQREKARSEGAVETAVSLVVRLTGGGGSGDRLRQ
tara:strand:- start:200 stop:589 length:390 start_codon:yes stop_codon:yes gene_type:complete